MQHEQGGLVIAVQPANVDDVHDRHAQCTTIDDEAREDALAGKHESAPCTATRANASPSVRAVLS